MHARRTASAFASASVVVRRSRSSLHLYIYISIYEAFPRPQQILYIFLAEQSRIITPLVQARARARLVGTWMCYVLQPRRANGFQGIFFIRYSILSLFFFYFFLAFLESHFILVDIVRTITQTKLNAEIVRRVFFLSLSYLYLYLLYLYIFICTI